MIAGLRIRLIIIALVATSLGACAHTSTPPSATQTPVRKADAARVHYLLLEGETGDAKKLLKQLLKQDPVNPSLLLLQQSIKQDPAELLGPKSYEYKVNSGETIEGLSDRLLGNRFKAYQLARYNNLETPVRLLAGQTIRIPGDRPVAPKVAPAAPRPTPQADKGSAKPREPSSTTKSSASPLAAQRARSDGLAALNRGQPDQAVLYLKRAQALDPGNQLIARDLQRAQRIASTVSQKK